MSPNLFRKQFVAPQEIRHIIEENLVICNGDNIGNHYGLSSSLLDIRLELLLVSLVFEFLRHLARKTPTSPITVVPPNDCCHSWLINVTQNDRDKNGRKESRNRHAERQELTSPRFGKRLANLQLVEFHDSLLFYLCHAQDSFRRSGEDGVVVSKNIWRRKRTEKSNSLLRYLDSDYRWFFGCCNRVLHCFCFFFCRASRSTTPIELRRYPPTLAHVWRKRCSSVPFGSNSSRIGGSG